MKKLFLTLLCAVSLYGQTAVNQVAGPPGGTAMQEVYTIAGGLTTAICYSPTVLITGNRARTRVAISAISKANPGIVTSVGHGFAISSRPSVTISGATGTGWVSGANTVNGTFVATVVDSDTFSIPVATTTNGTLGGTVVFLTTAPRSTMYEWAVQKIAYDGSSNAIWKGWILGSSAYQARCSDATSTSVGQQ